MANDKAFKVKNGLLAQRYLQSAGTETAGSEGYNLAGASYDSKSFSVAAQETTPRNIFFKPDGTKMYVVGTTSDTVYQYSLSTSWDISTASYDSKSLSVSAQDANPVSIFFKPDGTKMYMQGATNDDVYQYSLSTAWDLSTASYDSVSFDGSSQDTAMYGVFFKSDGTKMYLNGYATGGDIYQYSLSTAWDLSTASYDSVSFDYSPQASGSVGISFADDGSSFFIFSDGTDTAYKYTMSTVWDISTASYDSSSPVLTEDTGVLGFALGNSGQKLYIAGNTNDTIYQYSTVALTQTLDLSTGHYFSFSLTGDTALSLTNPPESGKAYAAQIEVTGGSTVVVNNISDAVYDSKSFSVSSQAANDSLAFKPDGTKMYCLNQGTRVGHQYTLSTPWDISTASYDSVTGSFTAETSSPSSLKFSSDGTKCYVLDSIVITDRIYQYTLSTAWDLSTVSYDSVNLNVNGYDTDGWGFCFNSAGTELYYLGSATETINQFSLGTAWDLSTVNYATVKSFSFAAQTAQPRNVIINLDGTKMYIVEEGNLDYIHQYTLSTPFDVSTASYDNNNFSLSSQEGSPRDIEFNNDFTKMYALGQVNSTVYQYTTGTNTTHVLTWPDNIKWDLGTAAPSPDPLSKDIYTLLTVDGGTTYYGKSTGEAVS